MPTKREREYYRMGFHDGLKSNGGVEMARGYEEDPEKQYDWGGPRLRVPWTKKKKRKLSAWNKFVKQNSKKPRFRLRSGSPNLKKLAVAFRKTPAGKKKRR